MICYVKIIIHIGLNKRPGKTMKYHVKSSVDIETTVSEKL